MELKHTATHPGRLSAFLKEEMGISTGLMNRLKWKDQIFVNGISRHTDYAVQPGDVISIPLDDPEPEYPAEDGPLTVLYEDDHLLAVDKPAGMLIHPSRARLTGTLANLVLGYYRKTSQKCAFHPVTRLDRDTYGIVLLAKNAHIHALMNQLHSDGKITKTYHALVYGCPETKEGVIDAPIIRLPLPSLLRKIDPEGKASVTEYRVLEQHKDFSKLSLRPITGRTHQLRLHCCHIGCPILGDPQYGSMDSSRFSEAFGLTGQLLCAVMLDFPHPVTGEPMHLTSQLDTTLPETV